MDDVKIEQIYMEDGREAERHVRDDGEQRVLELYVEPPRPAKKLTKRVIEKKRPVVYERIVETMGEGHDDNGQPLVVERKVEATDPKVEMKLLEHHVAQPQAEKVSAQSLPKKKADLPAEQYVTKDDLEQAILAVVKAVRTQPVEEQEEEEATVKQAPKLSMQQVVGERVEQSQTSSLINIGLAILIVAQVGALGYLLFWM